MVSLAEAQAQCLLWNLSISTHLTPPQQMAGPSSCLQAPSTHPPSPSLIADDVSNLTNFACVTFLSVHWPFLVVSSPTPVSSFLTHLPCNFDTDQDSQFRRNQLRIMTISTMSNFHVKGSASNSKAVNSVLLWYFQTS